MHKKYFVKLVTKSRTRTLLNFASLNIAGCIRIRENNIWYDIPSPRHHLSTPNCCERKGKDCSIKLSICFRLIGGWARQFEHKLTNRLHRPYTHNWNFKNTHFVLFWHNFKHVLICKFDFPLKPESNYPKWPFQFLDQEF